MTQEYASLACHRHAPINYYVQMTFALSQQNLVKIPPLIALGLAIHALRIYASNYLVVANLPVVRLGKRGQICMGGQLEN
jgi:hypothetical protein